MATLRLDALPIPEKHRDRPLPDLSKPYMWSTIGPFVVVHLLGFGALFVDVPWTAWALCLGAFWVRMFAITAGYHRYFSHRTFKTTRTFQFVLAFLSMTSSQRGVLWWAAHHRKHHKFSDTPWDVHSPTRTGFWHAHVGWIFYPDYDDTDLKQVRDLARFPELVWLDKHWLVPPLVFGAFCTLVAGLPGLFLGFGLSTALLWHAAFTINSLSHVYGRRRYPTTDTSRNSLLLALLTFGEGWHNNHHYYMGSTRQGFYWWEIDITYYVLKALSWLGIVWDLRPVPEAVLAEGRRGGVVPSAEQVIREGIVTREMNELKLKGDDAPTEDDRSKQSA
jgi:stearoyl-CoA desaturase (delta-9 desaturase)